MSPSPATTVDANSAYESSALLGVSSSAGALLASWQLVSAHYREPISRTTVDQRFAELAATWREETAAKSSLSEMYLSPSYQRIIALGESVVPVLLQALKEQPEHWFWALEMITGADPVAPDDAGSLPRMAAAWLAWGRSAGYRV